MSNSIGYALVAAVMENRVARVESILLSGSEVDLTHKSMVRT